MMMFKSFSSIAIALSLSSVVHGAFLPRTMVGRTNDISARAEVNYCGTHITSDKLVAAEDHFETTKRSLFNRQEGNVTTPTTTDGTITVVFHVLYANETFEGGYLAADDIVAQIDVMNAAFALTGFSFVLDTIEYVENQDWFLNAGFNDDASLAVATNIKKTLRVGDQKTLNVYTSRILGGILGSATFPHDFETNPVDDGIFIGYTSLPNSPVTPYNLGITLVHETGHWMGLYHTFEGGCEELGGGDRVVDTPAVAEANFGCPVNVDSCANNDGLDFINNFMDYTDDACLNSFSLGQVFRMQDQMMAYRGVDVIG